jgi:AraC-like DNA-binding protein
MTHSSDEVWIESLRQQIREGIRAGERVCGTWLADRNAMSMRTLQRRLGESGVRLRDLLRDERLRVVMRSLSTERVPIKVIATSLGYASTSSLCRAFRGWTNETTKAARRRASAKPVREDQGESELA